MKSAFELAAAKWRNIVKPVLWGSKESRGQARKRLTLMIFQKLGTDITFRRNGFVWRGHSSCVITQSIFLNDHYQDQHIKPLIPFIDVKRPVIVNIGANIGDIALPLSRVAERVIAIEPNPDTFARLKYNVSKNGLCERIICSQTAISDTEGTAELVVAGQPGNSEIRSDGENLGFGGLDQAIGSVQVKTKRLDDLVRTLDIVPDQVALVWSDTQGFESYVVASGHRLWASGVPLWVEIWPKGLDCHGGTAHFIDLCKQHFTHIVRCNQFGGEPEPIDALDAIIAGLKPLEFTDALLIPRKPGPSA